MAVKAKSNHSSAVVLALILSVVLGAAVYAQTASTTPPDAGRKQPPTRTLPPIKLPIKGDDRKPVDGACVATSIDTRDTAVSSALDTYHATSQAALKARTESLKAAWTGDTAARRSAIKAATEAFNKSIREANKVLRTAKQTVWKQFNTDVRKCAPNGGVSTSDLGTASMDENL